MPPIKCIIMYNKFIEFFRRHDARFYVNWIENPKLNTKPTRNVHASIHWNDSNSIEFYSRFLKYALRLMWFDETIWSQCFKVNITALRNCQMALFVSMDTFLLSLFFFFFDSESNYMETKSFAFTILEKKEIWILKYYRNKKNSNIIKYLMETS